VQRHRTAAAVFALAGMLALPGVGRAVAGAAPTLSPLAPGAASLGLSCVPASSTDGVAYTECSGEIASFDGVGIDTDLSIPNGATGSLPTILMLHGWGGDKTNWESGSIAGSSPDKDQWNNVWFVSRGWLVVNTTARGFGESCGVRDTDANCAQGWTHLADRSFEIRDWQTILGALVNAGLADPARLASTGGSYGGGQSWELATSMPWTSPAGVPLHLAAAVPKYPWTDLLSSLAPNGRASDGVDQSADHTSPFGVPKDSYISGLYALGRAVGGRYNTTDPTDPGSALDADYALLQSGEPYSAKPQVAQAVQAFRNKSAYDATDYLQAVRAGTAFEVPVFSIQGWTDPLFPPVETLQMYRELKAADPAYPVQMAFADVGHSNAQNPAAQWSSINALANGFLDWAVLGHTTERPKKEAYAFVTDCPPAGTAKPIAGRWDSLARRTVTLASTGAVTTTSAASNAADGAATDPIANAGCMSEPDAAAPPGVAELAWPVTSSLTLAGLPRVTLSYSLTGTDATIALKLWDVGSAGTKTLVTRGVYRLSTADGDPASGTLSVELFGNAWRVPAGDRLQLEIAQADAPYLRPDDLPSSISFPSVTLALPAR